MKKSFRTKQTHDALTDVFSPEFWANETLYQFRKRLVMARLINRNYNATIQKAGDVVNIDIPANPKTKRFNGTAMELETASAGTKAVRLNDRFYNFIGIPDEARSKSPKELVNLYLIPSVASFTETLELAIGSLRYRFLESATGKIGSWNPTDMFTIAASIGTAMSNRAIPLEGRRIVMNPTTAGIVGSVKEFFTASSVGDDGSALKTGVIGYKLGLDWITALAACPDVSAGACASTAKVTASAYAAGATSITVSAAFATAPDVGALVRIAGDDQLRRITAATTTVLTLDKGLSSAVASGAAVTVYDTGTVKTTVAKDSRNILVVSDLDAATTLVPGMGIRAGGEYYGILEAVKDGSDWNVMLNAIPDADITATSVVSIVPPLNLAFAFNENALTLLDRPLAMPPEGTVGVRSFNAVSDGFSFRAITSWDHASTTTRVSIDSLFGTDTLKLDAGVLCYV